MGAAILFAITAASSVVQAQLPADTKFIKGIEDRKYGETLPYLINGGSPNVRDFNGTPAIVVAATMGDAGMIGELLKHGANPNLADRIAGNTALIRGAARGSETIIAILLQAGADINLENKSGETPLIKAIQEEKVDAIKMLVSVGADLDQADYTGQTPYDYAVMSRNRRVQAALKDATNNR